MSEIEPRLDPPGKGLPMLQHWMARYYYFPKFCRSSTWESAQALHDREGKRILDLAAPLSEAQLQKRVLVHGVRGIEDSSRFWSVSMTMEHLIIVGTQMMEGMMDICRGQAHQRKADIAAVKPKAAYPGRTILGEYEAFLKRYKETASSGLANRDSSVTHFHPWFGNLTAFRWHCLAAAHTNLHRKQIQAILAGMSG